MLNKVPEFKHFEAQQLRKKLSTHNEKILQDFLSECAISVKNGTKLHNIERHMLKFYMIIGKDLDKWKKEDIVSLGIVLKNHEGSFHTMNEMITYLKLFARKQYRRNIDILEVLDKIKRSSKVIDDTKINENTLITPEELERMLRKAENFRQKALLLVIWESGARPQEVLELKWQDIKFDDEVANITLYSKKTNKTRTFPVKEASIHLKRWKQEYCFPNVKPSDYVFPNPNNRDAHLTSDGLNKFLRTIARKSGIDRRVWAYLFRHSRATALYEELPTPLVEKLMGHKKMFDVYAHISDKKAREELISKIYHIKELSPEKKAKFEREIEAQAKDIEKLKNYMKHNKEAINSGNLALQLSQMPEFREMWNKCMEIYKDTNGMGEKAFDRMIDEDGERAAEHMRDLEEERKILAETKVKNKKKRKK